MRTDGTLMIHVRLLSGRVLHLLKVMKTPVGHTVLSATLTVLLTVAVAHADDRSERDDDDHDEARHALEEGHVLPLADILASVTSEIEGEVVGVEFERQDGLYFYEFKVITPAGRLREVRVDAMSAVVITNEGD